MSRRVFARLPLRVRLVAAVVLLVTAALVAISVAGVAVLRGQLLDRIDGQLIPVTDSNANRPLPQNPGEVPPGSDIGIGPAGGGRGLYRVQWRDANGKVVNDASQTADDIGSPDVPDDVAWLNRHTGHPVTLPARGVDATWRVLVRPLHENTGWVVVAVSLGELNATISNLVCIDLVVGGLALLLLSIVSVVMIRAELRPLIEVEQTAAAIAAGDLSQRVPDHPLQTELGQLCRALNGMLHQIEEAFDARVESAATARRSEERMRRFVADAGHDLRTPLSVIRAWADYARQGPPRDRVELDRILSTVGLEATRMGTMVDDLLLLARLDQQRGLERQPVDLLALAVDAVRDAQLLAPDREIRLAADDHTAYLVTGDEMRLRQVLTNLTSNALTHTPPATPVLIRLSPGRLGDVAALVLDVVDQGPGLTAEQAERVFERFYRTDASRTRSGGSGLGLAIVDSLIVAHGGTVNVQSSPGGGATFRITLPLDDS
ncbi:HAMP domain-containing sensor histidine kinase [Kribbella solani]|uniref:HAMP domain-containing sensor histidine kinase n=1 Tax=Kribbella solani TaxID=236067 RepID=UPI0029B251CB|nr:HAMP domain-containing sensor histidine kinase [Kribbella solani]MDX3006578.1 HAMP domain-containing sensor histidine kinase [Kribbella solani]